MTRKTLWDWGFASVPLLVSVGLLIDDLRDGPVSQYAWGLLLLGVFILVVRWARRFRESD
ncbi:hypothetical protein Q0812_09805 [Brevundimonas sp. 2R-24]|uniref:Uncharacterized protein n=1 Tax=Peiella sedimenti TaxID=3061083 RepID=A0ABT8SMK4_9CAUL|nr:hypothetical protein [Caulobacteraceae bacterium XZ-24]